MGQFVVRIPIGEHPLEDVRADVTSEPFSRQRVARQFAETFHGWLPAGTPEIRDAETDALIERVER